jgi:hypothetical protein
LLLVPLCGIKVILGIEQISPEEIVELSWGDRELMVIQTERTLIEVL